MTDTFTTTISIPFPVEVIDGIEHQQEARVFHVVFTLHTGKVKDHIEMFSVTYSLTNTKGEEFDHSQYYDSITFKVDTETQTAIITRIHTPLLDHWNFDCYHSLIAGIEAYARDRYAIHMILNEAIQDDIKVIGRDGLEITTGTL